MESNIYGKTVVDIIKMVKEHVTRDGNYTAMTLVTDIKNNDITSKPWEEPKRSLIDNYVNPDIVSILQDVGFKFEFYPYRTHSVEKNGVNVEVVDTWALALIWYRWTKLSEIFRHYKV